MEQHGGPGPEERNKGKEKEREPSGPETQQLPPSSTPDPDGQVRGSGGSSVASRVANSAIALAGSVLASRPDNAFLAGSLSTGKGQSSSANPITHQQEGPLQPQEVPFGDRFSGTSRSQAHIAASEAAFAEFLDNASPLQSPGSAINMDRAVASHSTEAEGGSGSPLKRSMYESVAVQQQRDGEAVVALLSNGADVIFPGEVGDGPMSPGERHNLRRALFGESADTPRSGEWDNVLNFVPDYLRSQTQGSSRAGVPSSSPEARETAMHLGVSDPGHAWHIWVGQWSDVLSRYDDEVWGDLGPLVEQARSELQQLESTELGDGPPETKALRRLRAILGHIRGH